MARLFAYGVNAYPEYAQEGSGGPSYPPYPVVNETSSQANPNAPLQLGDTITDKFGNIYMYVRTLEILAVGQVVRYSLSGDASNVHPAAGTVAANTTVSLIKSTITTVADESKLGSFLASPGKADQTGTPFLKIIKSQVAVGSNTSFYISKTSNMVGLNVADGDQLSAIPQTGDAVAIIKPYTVVAMGAAAYGVEYPVGVVLGSVTAGNGTLILCQGLGRVLGVGDTDAIVAGSSLVSAAGGVVKGVLGTETAETDAYELTSVVGTALMAWAGASALIPAQIRCLKNI